MTILCDAHHRDGDVPTIPASSTTGRGQGCSAASMCLTDQTSPPEPVYVFNAVGPHTIDHEGQSPGTDLANSEGDPDHYDAIAVCQLDGDTNGIPQVRLTLVDNTGASRQGSDGLAIGFASGGDDVGRNGRVYVVVDGLPGSGDKNLLTYLLPLTSNSRPISSLSIEDTQVSMAYHRNTNRLILALEDGYRLQLVNHNG